MYICCMTANQTLGKKLYEAHTQYKEGSLNHRRFKHKDILPLIEQFKGKAATVSILGYSIEDRSINEVRIGSGSKNIMLWTQMHGDEPTSTMAVFDMLHFLLAKDEVLSEIRETILNNLELCFIPMLNPDGVERFQRRNAAEIDLNRDAVQLACPEARILKAAHQKNKPLFGFNLHDQSKYYNIPGTNQTASHSFLAPAYDYDKNINDVRKAAMQGIALMQEVLDELHPNQTGRYNDEFEPRAFGDNIQSWGTSTILVEAGGLRNDPEKQEIRRLHFSILLSLLYNIAIDGVKDYSIDKYWAIPENDRKLNDLIIRGVRLPLIDNPIDISINKEEINTEDGKSFYEEGVIENLGDLSTFFGYDEFDGKGLMYEATKIYNYNLASTPIHEGIDSKELLKEGIGVIKVANFDSKLKFSSLPFLIVDSSEDLDFSLKSGNKCAFFLKDEVGIKFAVINGNVLPL